MLVVILLLAQGAVPLSGVLGSQLLTIDLEGVLHERPLLPLQGSSIDMVHNGDARRGISLVLQGVSNLLRVQEQALVLIRRHLVVAHGLSLLNMMDPLALILHVPFK